MSLSTSFALVNAVNDAMADDSVKATAYTLMNIHDNLDEETFLKFMFEYSANLVSVTADLVTRVFMSEDEIKTMIQEAMEIRAAAEQPE